MVDPYALVAELYEAEHAPLTADVAFYARHAGAGPLLVLGCGTGRIGRALCGDRAVTGLDRSEAMLAVARRKAPGVRYLHGDMVDFELRGFGEIVVPNGAFNFLPSRAAQQRCLARCRRALRPGGALTLDMPMPAFHLWSRQHDPPVLAWEGEVQGRRARRTRETWRFPSRQRLELLDRYTLDGEPVAEARLELRIVMPAEVEWMLEACGFYVEDVYGDYADGALGDRSPRILVRAAPLP